jgi:hypothetical protein
MKIELTRDQILEYANRYVSDQDDVLGERMLAAATRGYMTRDDLVAVAKWKWRGGRTGQLCAQNTETEVQEISTVSFAAKSERLRIGALLALRGVQWPMASVILHFAFPDDYPILDVRAMATIGGSTLYTFEKWQDYVELCRETARAHNVAMRTLDKGAVGIQQGCRADRNPVVAFLASDDARSITGDTVRVDGGSKLQLLNPGDR